MTDRPFPPSPPPDGPLPDGRTSNSSNPDGGHPEQLLAAYVDGSASQKDRAAAERHLTSCATCRQEVQLASRARAALLALPELETPGVVDGLPLPDIELASRTGRAESAEAQATGVAGSPQAPPAPIGRPTTSRRARWDRLAWVGGLAAAASLVVIILARLGGGAGNAPSSAAMGPSVRPSAATSTAARAAAPPTNYTEASLAALARRLATQRESKLAGQSAPTEPLAPSQSGPPTPTGQSPVLAAVACARQAAGVPADVQAVHVEVGSFNGTPAYIVGFLSGQSHYLMLVAASQDGCRALNVI